MDYLDLVKRAWSITWRYRPLWLFGFLLALCSGGGGGGNIRLPGNSVGGDFGDGSSLPNLDNFSIEPELIFVIIGVGLCLFLLLIAIQIVVPVITRTALIGMVDKIETDGVITIREGWQFGWSARAWRLFLINLLIGLPRFIITMSLIIVALLPLLLIITEETSLIILGVALTVIMFLFVLLILFLLNLIIAPFQEIAWRKTVLEERGVFDSAREAITFGRTQLKEIVLLYLVMFAVGFGWAMISLIIVLPVSLIAAALVGGIPALLVYLISESWLGAALAGGPLALLVLMVLVSAAQGLYLIFQSAMWTLAYLRLKPGSSIVETEKEPPLLLPSATEPQSE